MGLIEVIEKIQKQPYHRRVQILWLLVFIFGFLIIFLEIIFFKRTLNSPELGKNNLSESKETVQQLKNLKEEVPSLWANLKEGLGTLFEENKNSDGNIPIEEKIEEKTIRLPSE